MTKYFVPYTNENIPAAIEIKGHRLLLLCTDETEMLDDLDIIGGETVRELNLKDNQEEQTEALADLAARVNGGVVLTPPGVSLERMIQSLETELPWVH